MTTPRQLHDLPSMRGSGPAVGFVPRRRRGPRRLLALLALAALGSFAVRGAATSAAQEGPPVEPPAATGALVADAPPDPTAPPQHATRPFAEVQDLRLLLPSDDALLVGFHEASLPGALALEPYGTGRSNANTTRITLPPDHDDGADYHVMSSRGRSLPPTSAADIVLRDDDPVLAPVDGVVTEVRPYQLYGSHPDTRIEIQPDDAPDLRVVIIHVDGVRATVGQQVTAGTTVLAATANRFPFSSHVDRYLDDRWPHVHVEVKDPSEARDASGG